MHFAFIPYGARTEVERFLRDVESQKFQLKLSKKGEKDKHVWVTGQIRELPFGVKEIVFPREYKDMVVATMTKNTAPNRQKEHYAYKPIMSMLRKGLRLKSLPREFNQDNKFIWDLEHVSIMPLGIREDSDLKEEKDMGYKGWNHESL